MVKGAPNVKNNQPKRIRKSRPASYYRKMRARTKQRRSAELKEAERKLLELQAQLVALQQTNARLEQTNAGLERELAVEKGYNSFLAAGGGSCTCHQEDCLCLFTL